MTFEPKFITRNTCGREPGDKASKHALKGEYIVPLWEVEPGNGATLFG